MSKVFPISIGRSARSLAPTPEQQARRRHRACISWPPRCDPRPPDDGLQPFTNRRLKINGMPHEIALWIPGPHPPEAQWWEEISMWWVLRPVVMVAPPQLDSPAANSLPDGTCDPIDGWTWIEQSECSAY
ncbi:MAG: hypothetical protein ACLQVD_08010 [Capsulimonadaceae bacterium]